MRHQLELRHLNYFMAVAEELHFRKAAERLFISQPGLTRQIQQMEEVIQAKLFERSKRKVLLTPAGDYLKAEAEFIFNHLDFVIKQTQRIAEGSKGEVRIGFLGSAMQKIIPEILVQSNREHPDIDFSLEEMSNHNQLQFVGSDKLDLGFVRLSRVPEDIQKMIIQVDSFSLVVPEDHFLTKENFQSVAQVADEHFILFSASYSSVYYDKLLSICEDKGFTPKVSHKSVHAQTIFKLVESGLGVAIVPTTLKEGFHFKLRFLEIPDIQQKAELSVIWKENNRNPALHKLIPFLKKLKV